MAYFCNGKKGICGCEEKCSKECKFFNDEGGFYLDSIDVNDAMRYIFEALNIKRNELASEGCTWEECYEQLCVEIDHLEEALLND